MKKFDTAAPYLAAFAILRDGNKAAFVLRKNTSWMDGFYGLPSGKVEWGETFTQAAIREAKEEIGVDIVPSDVHHALTIHRHSKDCDWIDMYFEVTKWEGEVTNAEPDVHSEVAWLDINNLPDNVVPPFRQALELIAKNEKYSEQGWNGDAL